MSRHSSASVRNPVPSDADQFLARWFPLASIWALGLLSFSLPGRIAPEAVSSIDVLALGKLVARLAIMLFAAWMLYDRKREQRAGSAAWIMAPLYLWLGWSYLSVLWSPIPVISLGQACGMAAILLLAAVIGTSPAKALPDVMRHTSAMLFVGSLATLLLHVTRPELSGLDRELNLPGSDGFVHPTAAGATASLGLVLGVLARFCWPRKGFDWAASLSFGVHLAVLILASSRFALTATVIVCLTIVIWSVNPRKLGWPLLVASAGILTYLAVDPGFQKTRELLFLGIGYVKRGQTEMQIQGLSGRREMWDAIIAEIAKSPWIGHGYFSTSAAGKIFVWNSWGNHTAHNIILQLLATGGVVGTALFLWGMWRAFHHPVIATALNRAPRPSQVVVAFGMLWYLIWTVGCISFIGPVRPESVVFAVVLGMSIHPFGDADVRRSNL